MVFAVRNMVEDSKTGNKISFFSVSKISVNEFEFFSFLIKPVISFSHETSFMTSCDSPTEYNTVDASITREIVIMIGKFDFTLQN